MENSTVTNRVPLPPVEDAIVNTIVQSQEFTFGVADYLVFVIMLCTSAGIGIYFGFYEKAKNTTAEYLMGGKKMKTIPIAISLVASQLSGIAIMTIPAEYYSFGINHIYSTLSIVLVVPILCYVIIPVFYENQITNCYEYLEMRFDKRTRQLVTASFVLHAYLMLPLYMFVPSLAFSQVTGINIHLINTIVCSICIFYTMLGGIKAVVWTDVVQGGIMLFSVLMVAFLGVYKIGGLGAVLQLSDAGGRLNTNFSWDPRIRISLQNGFFGGLLMWVGHIGLNQSCVQRIVSLPSKDKAKRSLLISGVGFLLIMTINGFTGLVMFARYYGCDPMKAGLVEKPDKMMPFFVQDIMGNLAGMPGLFISCVFSAALSTMSANLNSLAGVVYFDYIKPYIKHTEERANYIMKVFVVVVGIYCILGGVVVQQFKSIFQITITISGITTGAVVGVFMLGMFVPRCDSRCAVIGIVVSMCGMVWIIYNAQIKFSSGIIQYTPLPTSIDQCENHTLSSAVNITAIRESATLTRANIVQDGVTTAFESNRKFSIDESSFYCYKIFGVLLVWIVAIPLSYLFKSDEHEKLNPHLYSPFVRKLLKMPSPVPTVEMEEMPLNTTLTLDEKPPHLNGPQNGNAAKSQTVE